MKYLLFKNRFKKKVVFCQPQAGLNDVLNQIALCVTYAERHKRILVIDTARGTIGVCLFDFMLPLPNQDLKIWRMSEELASALDKNRRVRPRQLRGQVSSFLTRRDSKRRLRVLRGTKTQTSFDMRKSYYADIVVHCDSGGGERAPEVLHRLAFKRPIAEQIGARVAALGSGYQAIHVRNTDMQTDFKPYFEELKPQLNGQRVLICSDDAQCKAYAHSYFESSEVLEITDTPDLEGKRLHGNEALDPFQQVFDSFLDLMAMATASRLHFTSPTIKEVSGFSRLAKALQEDKDLRDKLMTLARPEDRVTMGLTAEPLRAPPDPRDVEPELDVIQPWRT